MVTQHFARSHAALAKRTCSSVHANSDVDCQPGGVLSPATAKAQKTESSFAAKVYAIVARVPRGQVVSYGQIAWMLGNPRAARQVGWAMRYCPDNLPWQRVVKADGSIAAGGYAEMRRALLEAEGVPFLNNGRVDLRACRWMG